MGDLDRCTHTTVYKIDNGDLLRSPGKSAQHSGMTYRAKNRKERICCCCCCQVSSAVSDSARPHRRQPTRSPRPCDSPGKNTGVGCHFLLQCMKVKSLSRVRVVATPWTAAHQAPPSMGFSGKSTGVGRSAFSERVDICLCVTDSLCGMPETNTTL